MEKLGKIKDGDNCLSIYISGDQSYVKIYDAGGGLLRHTETKGAITIFHRASPGEYKIETDGTIKRVASSILKLD